MRQLLGRISPAAMATLTLAAGMAGCSASCTPLDTGTQAIKAAAPSGGLLEVDTDNGSVSIARADVAELEIDATIRADGQDRLEATRIVAEPRPDGGVHVFVVWPDGKRRSNEGCSLQIRTPDAAGLDVDTSNGRITIAGLAGPARLDTSNGSISITDHRGDVFADTSNGRVEAHRIVGNVHADTSNGSIHLEAMAGEVVADTSNASITLVLADGAPGPFNLDTSNGSVRVTMPAGFGGTVDASTSNGSVRVTGARTLDSGRSWAKATFGEGGPRSVIRTSNGSVQVATAHRPRLAHEPQRVLPQPVQPLGPGLVVLPCPALLDRTPGVGA